MRIKFVLLTLGLVLLSQITIAQVPSYVPTNGLVGFWPFNGNANDESGNGNNGTNNGATLTTDRFGNVNSAYNFNGINNYINAVRNNLNQFSVSLWFNPNSSQEFSPFVDANLRNWEIYLKYLKPTFTRWITAPFNYQEFISTTTVPLSQWQHIVYTYTPNNVDVYLNGILISSFSNVSLVISNNGLYYFGASISGTSQFYAGKLDDIGIWNRALTQDEIISLYQAEVSCQSLVINSGTLSSFNPPVYQSTVTIYPNPANDQITIDCGNLANVSGWSIKIVNAIGQEVFSGAMNTPQYVVPLNSWSGQGMYFVKIYDAANNLVNTKKIILQ